MILSHKINIATSLVLTALIAASLGYYAGMQQHAPEIYIPSRTGTQTHGNAGFSGPLVTNVERVIDGDTFKARLQVWFGQDVLTSVRIRGFDAPELKGKCAEEMKAAQDATDMLRDILNSGPVTLHDIGPDKYFGRVVASVRVKLKDGIETDVAEMMIAAGMGRPYNGGARGSWCGKVAGR